MLEGPRTSDLFIINLQSNHAASDVKPSQLCGLLISSSPASLQPACCTKESCCACVSQHSEIDAQYATASMQIPTCTYSVQLQLHVSASSVWSRCSLKYTRLWLWELVRGQDITAFAIPAQKYTDQVHISDADCWAAFGLVVRAVVV